jgi:DNA-binding NarL/FixJ family response regulator
MSHISGRMRILLADDYEPVLREVEALLAPEFDVVAKVQRADLMVSATHDLRPDIVIADIAMPGGDGIWASEEILKRSPDLPIVLLTMRTDPELVHRALSAGVLGYVHKVQAGEELIPAVRAALAGHVFVSPSCFARSA